MLPFQNSSKHRNSFSIFSVSHPKKKIDVSGEEADKNPSNSAVLEEN
jgi:hypothetical protein